MMTLLRVVGSAPEVDNIYQVESDNCVLMAVTVFWPKMRFNRVKAYITLWSIKMYPKICNVLHTLKVRKEGNNI